MFRSTLVSIVGIFPWIFSISVGVFVSNFFNSNVGIAVAVFLISALISWLLILCLLGSVFSKGIKAVKVQRSLKENDYFVRALYGRTWTSLFYFKTLYTFILANVWLRNFVFRSFGYEGSSTFTLFPDAWIRDLPLLKISKGAYIANRATLGTNLCLQDNSTVVGSISLGTQTLVGHLSIVGLGSKLEDESEIGVNSIVGVRVRIGAKAVVGGRVTINHGVRVGKDCMIGAGCYLGIRSVIAEGIHLPQATIVPEGKILSLQEDVDKLISSERRFIADEKDKIEKLLVKYNSHL